MAWTDKALPESTSQAAYQDIDAGASSGITIGSGISLPKTGGVTIGNITALKSTQITDDNGWTLKSKVSLSEV